LYYVFLHHSSNRTTVINFGKESRETSSSTTQTLIGPLKAHIADVGTNLCSVDAITSLGHSVIFQPAGASIFNDAIGFYRAGSPRRRSSRSFYWTSPRAATGRPPSHPTCRSRHYRLTAYAYACTEAASPDGTLIYGEHEHCDQAEDLEKLSVLTVGGSQCDVELRLPRVRGHEEKPDHYLFSNRPSTAISRQSADPMDRISLSPTEVMTWLTYSRISSPAKSTRFLVIPRRISWSTSSSRSASTKTTANPANRHGEFSQVRGGSEVPGLQAHQDPELFYGHVDPPA
jgi:hypothetical protein